MDPECTPASDTAALLEDVQRTYERFVLFSSEHAAVAMALWTLHTHVFDAFDVTPYLWLWSATPQSGKTRVLEVGRDLVRHGRVLVGISEAVLFRIIEQDPPTLLLDEIDALFGQASELTQGIRGVLDTGFSRRGSVPRCVPPSMKVKEFPTYCPKGFATIGKTLPATLQDRSIPIMMRRRAPDELKPEPFREGVYLTQVTPLAEALGAWGAVHLDTIGSLEPVLPDELTDRQQDCWRPLFVIAELAGGDWLKKVECAALYLHADEPEADLSLLLLQHCRDAFEDLGVDRLPTTRLINHLIQRGDSSPWAFWWRFNNEQAAAQGLAKHLEPFDIGPKTVRFADRTQKGYLRSQFESTWRRYRIAGASEPGTPPPEQEPLFEEMSS
jgi:hypothetical protein